MRRTALPLLLLALVASAGCGEGEDATRSAEATPARTANGCDVVAAPRARTASALAAPTERLSPDGTHVATVRTNCGDFDITLDVERAPLTTSSFAHLVRQDFYDGLGFHRVLRAFVIQGGDPRGDGLGGPGYTVREAPPRSLRYDRGVVAMAKSPTDPPGTSGSQFFVVIEGSDLPPEYALLGRVTRGMETVERIAAVELAAQKAIEPERSTPADPMVISDVTIAES